MGRLSSSAVAVSSKFSLSFSLPTVAVCALCAAALFVGVYVVIVAPMRDMTTLKEELTPYRVPKITYAGQTYEVTQGIVSPTPKTADDERAILRIARYAVEQRRDPVMTLPGVDLLILKKNITHLEESARAFAEAFAHEKKSDALTHMYPVDFLRELATLEEYRRALLYEASDEHIRAYDAALTRTLAAYETYTTSLRPLLMEDAPQQGNYVMWGGTVDAASAPRALDALEEAHARVQDMREARLRCYTSGRTCTPFTEAIFAPLHTKPAPAPLAHIGEHAEIYDAYAAAAVEPRYSVVSSTQPLIAIETPSCAPHQEYGYYRYWYFEDARGRRGIRTENLEDIYIAMEEGENPYRVFMRENSIEFEHQSSGNFYLCPESGDDFGRIMSLARIQEAVRTEPLSSRFPELDAVETALLHTSLLDEAHVSSYLEALAQLIGSKGERAFDDDTLLHAYELFDIWHAQSGGFEYALGSMAHWNDHMVTIAPLLKPDPWFMFTTRGYFSFLLLPYNKSFVGDTARISFFKDREAPELTQTGYETYRTGRFASLSPEAFTTLLIETRNAAEAALATLRISP